MNTIHDFHLCDHTILGEGVITSDTQLLRFKNNKASADLSVAIHTASRNRLSRKLAFRSVTSPPLLRAFHTLSIIERHFGNRGPSYILDAGLEIRIIGDPLKRYGVDVQFRNSMHYLQKVHVERFFREMNRSEVEELKTSNTDRSARVSSTLASLRKLLTYWFQFFHNRTSLHQPAAKTFNRQVSPLSPRNRNREWLNNLHLQDCKRAHRQNDPQRGRSLKDDHYIR
ncbi:hypothetical protein KVG88_13660 [Pseudomonas sp. SWRI74]|uniref:Uncharacterized protein n=1 Tax=Pseudomonas azerbaijanoccidentalis TaxID=2842347 RepID=A0ABS6QRF8_9PSED|nr:hypothetical protein [Pseudomonas azerbaijanoccidentalis]MBV4521112.1 hypothetical protein [Pseudomonas azerbaijanoccidentalis]